MGEWSDFFEDFPEENPANWINGVYIGPKGAQLHHEHQVRVDADRAKVAAEQGVLSWRVDRGLTGLRPGNNQPPGSILPFEWAERHQVRSALSKLGESIA